MVPWTSKWLQIHLGDKWKMLSMTDTITLHVWLSSSTYGLIKLKMESFLEKCYYGTHGLAEEMIKWNKENSLETVLLSLTGNQYYNHMKSLNNSRKRKLHSK